MPKLPIIKPKELIRVLHKLDFIEIRQKGSHMFFYRQRDNRATSVPFHVKDLGKGLLRKILHQINLNVDDFIKLLKK